MATLTNKQRKAMPQSDYALPGKRFPVEDRTHAANAKARATQGVKAGTLSPAQKTKVDAAANKTLNKGKKK